MKTIQAHYKGMMEEAIKDSRWFRTAPAKHQATATFKLLGVEQRQFGSMLCTTAIRPALIAECVCGGETQRFSMLLDGQNPVHQED